MPTDIFADPRSQQILAGAFGPISDASAEPPDPYALLDDKELIDRFEKAKKEATDLRENFERLWWRNLLYILGKQWVIWDLRRGTWRDRRLKKWIPTPVTNIIRNGLVAIRAVFSSIRLGIVARPIGGDEANVTAANVADQLEPLVREEHDIDGVFFDGDFWHIATGNWFLHPHWDKDDPRNGTMPVMEDICPECQMPQAPEGDQPPPCPTCGGPMMREQTGEQTAGRGKTDAVSPFEVLLPSDASSFEEVRRIIRVRWRTKAYYEAVLPEFAKDPSVVWEKSPTEKSLQLYKTLANQTELLRGNFSWGGGQGHEFEGLTEYEMWEQPSKEYPDGLFYRVAGEKSPQIIHLPDESTPGPLPYATREGKPIFPWIHVPYERFGGRVWAMGALDPAIQKQDQVNRLDSLIELIVNRMANPVWVIPKGEEIERFEGQPGWVMRYPMVGPAGSGKPERIDGSGPHASLFQLREQYIRDAEEALGTFDILKGQRPPNVEAFSALQLLVERSQSRFTTAFKERGRAYRRWYQIALELERTYGPTKRTVALMGPNKSWAFKQFEAAQLDGQVQILVEDGSEVPKTSLGKRAAVEQLNQMGALDIADPDQKYALFTMFGLPELIPSLDNDVKSALEEQDSFEKWAAGLDDAMQPGGGAPVDPQAMLAEFPLVVRSWHDHAVHYMQNRKWMNTDRVREILRNKPELSAILDAHLAEHQMMMVQQAMLMAGPQPGAPGGGGGAMVSSNQESGATDTVPAGNAEGQRGESVQGPA